MNPKKVRRCPRCKWIGVATIYCRDSRDACAGHCPVCKDSDTLLSTVSELEEAVWRGQQEDRKLG